MDKINFKGILAGICTALIITAILIFIISAVFYFTDVPENIMKYFSFAALFIGMLISGFLLSKNSESGKGISGILLGIFVFLILFLINLVFGDGIKAGFFINLAISVLGALLGVVAGN